jgi:hypothetical protein
MNWEPLSNGWFVQWAVENKARQNPTKAIRVYDGEVAICGYVPDDWGGQTLCYTTRPGLSTGEGGRASLATNDRPTEPVRQPVSR